MQNVGSEPIECTDDNKGHCECADVEGFQTYTFMVGDDQRCFTTYFPPNRDGEILPLVLSPNCYAKDLVGKSGWTKPKTSYNVAARQFGFARIHISSPEGNYYFKNLTHPVKYDFL